MHEHIQDFMAVPGFGRTRWQVHGGELAKFDAPFSRRRDIDQRGMVPSSIA